MCTVAHREDHWLKCFKVAQILKKSYEIKQQTTNTLQDVITNLYTNFNSNIQLKKTSFNMKLKTNRRLIFLLTFMLANYNVLASLSCLKGCQHSTHNACKPTSTGCSDGEICSRFKIEEAYDDTGEWFKNLKAHQLV